MADADLAVAARDACRRRGPCRCPARGRGGSSPVERAVARPAGPGVRMASTARGTLGAAPRRRPSLGADRNDWAPRLRDRRASVGRLTGAAECPFVGAGITTGVANTRMSPLRHHGRRLDLDARLGEQCVPVGACVEAQGFAEVRAQRAHWPDRERRDPRLEQDAVAGWARRRAGSGSFVRPPWRARGSRWIWTGSSRAWKRRAAGRSNKRSKNRSTAARGPAIGSASLAAGSAEAPSGSGRRWTGTIALSERYCRKGSPHGVHPASLVAQWWGSRCSASAAASATGAGRHPPAGRCRSQSDCSKWWRVSTSPPPAPVEEPLLRFCLACRGYSCPSAGTTTRASARRASRCEEAVVEMPAVEVPAVDYPAVDYPAVEDRVDLPAAALAFAAFDEPSSGDLVAEPVAALEPEPESVFEPEPEVRSNRRLKPRSNRKLKPLSNPSLKRRRRRRLRSQPSQLSRRSSRSQSRYSRKLPTKT